MIKFQRVIPLVVLGLSLLQSAAAAQEPARQEPRIIKWQVEFADGTRAKLMAPVGETNRVTRQDGSVIAFSPVKDRKTGEIRLRVSEVITDSKKSETLRELALLRISEKAESVHQVSDFTVKILPIPADAKPIRNEAMGLPLSNRMIRWDLTLADGRVVRLAAIEGQLARLRMADGQTFGLVPIVRGDQEERIEFRLFSVGKRKDSIESLRLVESFGLEEGGEYFPSAWEGSLMKISKAAAQELSAGMEKLYVEPTEIDELRCCVGCGGVRACGCAVSMDCGECCVPPCCYEPY